MYEELPWVFGLLCLFQVKHYVADFPLQVPYMLQKVRPGWDFFIPLAVHCSVHTVLSLSIILAVNPAYWWLALLDGVTHFIMDRIKSGPSYLGRFKDANSSAFWNALGFDQMVHHLTNFYMVFVMVTDQLNPFSPVV